MISENDKKRIRGDVSIAIDALDSLLSAPNLHPEYIKEKIETVKRCVRFIEHFYPSDEK